MKPDSYTVDHREFGSLSAELIEDQGGLRFRASGKSMLPSIHDGDVLTIEKTDPADIGIGDVVMVRMDPNSLLVHRVIKHEDDCWTTCGDAVIRPDAPFRASQLLGRVSAIDHNGQQRMLSKAYGRFIATLSRHGNWLICRILRKLRRVADNRFS